MSEASTSNEREIILVTGAAGMIGSMLRSALARPGRTLRLLDVVDQAPLVPGEDAELVKGSFVDATVMAEACKDVNAILHFGGLSTKDFEWDQFLEVNVNGTYVVLEAARVAGVARVIYASSNHAVGFEPFDRETLVRDYVAARPDTFYGASKAASESLGSLYHDRYGLDVVCLRIGTYGERPVNYRQLWSWLSPGDCARLVEAAMNVPHPGFRIVWGVSANRRAAVTLNEGHAIGYFPRDDSELFVDDIAGGEDFGRDDPPLIGGPYTLPDEYPLSD